MDVAAGVATGVATGAAAGTAAGPGSYTHLRAHETKANPVFRLLLEKKNTKKTT